MPYLMNNTGFIYTLETALRLLLGFKVIFIGEEHLSQESHEAEIAVRRVVGHDPNLVLALEMFERDIQPLLDDYLKEQVSEEEFLEGSRPWPNYPEDHRPLVELAKSRGLPVIAANVPRRAAAAVAKANRISRRVMGPDAVYLPPAASSLIPGNTNGCSWPPWRICPPWAPWARSSPRIVQGTTREGCRDGPGPRTFFRPAHPFRCGHFHSDYYLGIPYQFRKKSRPKDHRDRHGIRRGQPAHARTILYRRFLLGPRRIKNPVPTKPILTWTRKAGFRFVLKTLSR